MGIETERGFFFELTPDQVLEAVETTGLLCTGRCMALNSFENRVYDVELESDEQPEFKHLSANRRIVKFYRPGRWTKEQILEEHEFVLDLKNSEIPAVYPLRFPDGSTVKQIPKSGIWYTLFPKVGGRAPAELSDEQLIRVGRLLGRIHNTGAQKLARHRLKLDIQTYGRSNLKYLIERQWIPLEFQARYKSAVEKICEISTPFFETVQFQRIHGDCHLGNLLWNQSGPFFLDFDDMVMGPEVQDIWLLIPGRDPEAKRQRAVLLEGYREFRDFDLRQLRLIEPLRALRFIHYTAWVAKRWDDPAFPQAFPQFGSHQYWRSETEDLEEQLRLIENTDPMQGL